MVPLFAMAGWRPLGGIEMVADELAVRFDRVHCVESQSHYLEQEIHSGPVATTPRVARSTGELT